MVRPVMMPPETLATTWAPCAPMSPPMPLKLTMGEEVKPCPGFRMTMSAACTPVTPESEETVWWAAPLASPSCRMPAAEPEPEPTKSSAAEGRRLLAPPPSTRRPLATVVEPAKVVDAARVREPVPALVRPPALAPAAPPIALAKTRSLVVTSMVPPAERKVTGRCERSSAKPGCRRKVPPARTTLPVAPPMLSRSLMASTPSLTVVLQRASGEAVRTPPPAVFVPESTSVPRPDLVRLPAEVRSEAMTAVRRGEMADEPGLMTWKRYSLPGTASDRPPVRARVTVLSVETVAAGFSVKR